MEGPTVVVVVVGHAPTELEEGLIRAIKDYLGEDSHTLLDVSEESFVTYADYRAFCLSSVRTSNQGYGWAKRGWWQFVSSVAKARAACDFCGESYGRCRCKEQGFKGSHTWVYRDAPQHWVVPRKFILELTEEQLQPLVPAHRRRLLSFALSLYRQS